MKTQKCHQNVRSKISEWSLRLTFEPDENAISSMMIHLRTNAENV